MSHLKQSQLVDSHLLDAHSALLQLSRRARLHKWSFCFFIDLFFPIAGRAQYFLQPDFQWVWAGAGDHKEGHHCYRPRLVLWQPQATGWTAGHRFTGPEQPCSQVRGHSLPPLSQNCCKSYLNFRDIFREPPKQCQRLCLNWSSSILLEWISQKLLHFIWRWYCL